MPTASYEARPYIALTKNSIPIWGTLTAADRKRLTDFSRLQVLEPSGTEPTGEPWTGTIPLAANGEVNFGFVHALANTLIDDWNANYDLTVEGGNAGSSVGSTPRQTTYRYRWIDGVLVRVPNYSLVAVGGDGDVFDPFEGAPNNPGIRGTLRLEIVLTPVP